MNHVLRATRLRATRYGAASVLLVVAVVGLASTIQAQDAASSPVTITLVRWPFT
jgi:hypothetical protein